MTANTRIVDSRTGERLDDGVGCPENRANLLPLKVELAMASPECGDLILRGSLSAGFLVIDAASQRRLFGPVQLQKAVRLAKEHGAQVIWQELVDDCGQPLGPPLRFKIAAIRSSSRRRGSLNERRGHVVED